MQSFDSWPIAVMVTMAARISSKHDCKSRKTLPTIIHTHNDRTHLTLRLNSTLHSPHTVDTDNTTYSSSKAFLLTTAMPEREFCISTKKSNVETLHTYNHVPCSSAFYIGYTYTCRLISWNQKRRFNCWTSHACRATLRTSPSCVQWIPILGGQQFLF